MAARFGATIVPFGAVGEDDIAEVSLCFCFASYVYIICISIFLPFSVFKIFTLERWMFFNASFMAYLSL